MPNPSVPNPSPLNAPWINSGWMDIWRSPIGKKLLTGITGLGLASFVVAHMLGNLLLFVSPAAFNHYATSLETSFKPLVWAVELGLGVAIALHATLGIQIYIAKRNARPIAYANYQSVNPVSPKISPRANPVSGQVSLPSFQTLSSRTMIATGLVLAIFTIWHLATFKFGPRYDINLEGHTERDLARLVIETFRQPLYTASYVGLISLLSLHLRHGLWSAFQSLGVLGKGTQAAAFGASLVGAGAIAAGFGILPIAIFCGWIR